MVIMKRAVAFATVFWLCDNAQLAEKKPNVLLAQVLFYQDRREKYATGNCSLWEK